MIDKKKTKEQLKESAIYLDIMGDALIVLDAQASVIKVNKSFSELWGYTPDEVLGKPVFGMFPEEELAKYQSEMENAAKEGGVRTFETIALTKDKKEINVSVSGTVLKDEKGKLLNFIALFRDIFERKRAEESLRESDERFRVALKSTQITVFTQDRDLRFTWAYNPSPDFDADFVLGKTDEDLVGTEQAARTMAVKRRVLETGKGIREELSTIMGGKTLYYDLTVEPLYDENDEIVGIVCASIDIADRKKHEEALIKLKDELEITIAERTKELQERIKELERFHEATMDRELRMNELRKEIAELKKNKEN